MVFKFYNSGICFSEILVEGKKASHKILNVFNGKWEEKKSDDDLSLYYPIDIKRVTDRINDALKFDFSNNEDAFEIKGEKYLLQDSYGDTRIYAHRNIQMPLVIIVHDNEFIGIIETERTGCSVIVKSGYENQTPIKIWKTLNASSRLNLIKAPENVKIPMRDGTLLNGFVWLPDSDDEKYSTILLRTPYGSKNYWTWLRKYVMRGYALLIQDVRGREESEGDWIPFYYERNDGSDTLDYIASQTWSNGRVGMIGGSYSGAVQWAADTSGNPHLKAIVSLVTAGSPFGDIPRKGGAILSGSMAWAFAMADIKMKRDNMIRDDWDELLASLPIKDIPMKGLGKNVKFINEWMCHENYDSFWENADWTNNPISNDTPALIVSGWYDDDGTGSKEAWKLCKRQDRSNRKMILGPWLHNTNSTRDINGIDFGNRAIRYDLDKIYLDWFDRYLEDKDNGIESMDSVQYYLCGENGWQTSGDWPPEHSKNKFLFMSGNGECSFDCCMENHLEKYIYDPKDPTPFLIDVSSNECNVPANYSRVEKRSDVLTFTSQILEEELVISGELKGRLYASSSCKDTDWLIRLTEVIDDETSIRISDGILRARYRDGFSKNSFMEAEKIYKFDIDMFSAAHRFSKGSKIRLSVMSGAKNLVFPNQNTGNNPAHDTKMLVAEQSIYCGKDYPSGIYIPIININE